MKKLGPAAGNIHFSQDVQVQIRMANQVLDGYSPSTKIGYFFNGCWEHGHKGCPIMKRGDSQIFFVTFLRYLLDISYFFQKVFSKKFFQNFFFDLGFTHSNDTNCRGITQNQQTFIDLRKAEYLKK